ncbi:MAG: GNAT family N-acetyltransferase [Vicinamibacterales bacterium]
MTAPAVTVVHTQPEHFAGITELSRLTYPGTPPWNAEQLASHRRVFPEGQFVALETATGRVVGMAASLIVFWDDYDSDTAWRDFTDKGLFTNHDPVNGRTLYGAEVMVHPDLRGHGIGSKIYDARRELVVRLGLLRIRAGARLRGYHRHADRLTPRAYVDAVVSGQIRDPTLSFQLHRGFKVIAVVGGYLLHDPESLGYAAVIEWMNARARDGTP